MECKKILTFAVMLFVLFSCQETTEPTENLSNLEKAKTSQLNFSGEEGAIITLKEAQDMTLKYQQTYPNQTRAFFVGRDHLKRLLNQDAALGLRFYLGLNVEQLYQMVGVGVDDTGTDLLNQSIVHATVACPSGCNTDSPLWHGEKDASAIVQVDAKDGEQITVDQAQLFTHFYQKLFPKSQKAFFFGQEVLQELLKEDAEGLWFYMGINEIDELELLPTIEIDRGSARFAEVGPAMTADRSTVCPPACDYVSLLDYND